MDRGNQTLNNEGQPQDKEDLFDAVCERLNNNITKSAADPQFVAHLQAEAERQVGLIPGAVVPQRLYCQGTAIPEGEAPQTISFAMANESSFPAELALAGQYNLLVDGESPVFAEQNQTINLRVEWAGYDGWGVQIRTVNYQENRMGITRAKLVTEIAKQLVKFIEVKRSVAISPDCAMYRVGPGGIELRHLHIVSLKRVSRGSWQPCFIYGGP